MEEILLKLRRLTQQVKDSSAQTITDLKPTIETIKTNFDEWKVPWTAERASKIDRLDAPVSTRASEVTANNIQDNTTLTLEKVLQLFPAGASKTFTTPGTHTFTVPDGVGIVTVFCVGAGGGGGGSANNTRWNIFWRCGGGGGGGGKREGTISVTPGTKLTVVVGAGGAGGAVDTGDTNVTGGTGGTGGSSSVGGIIATGGSGGGGGTARYSQNKISGECGAGGAGGISEGNPGTAGDRGPDSDNYQEPGHGGAAPSTYGSYGRGGAGGGESLSKLVGKAGLGGFVRITY